MTISYTYTLKDATSSPTTTAVIRYPTEETAYPNIAKAFTKYQLSDGSYAYDCPTYSTKRRWEMEVITEDTSDNLLANLNTLYNLNTTLYLDEDALIVSNNISVFFEEFQPIYQTGNWYIYRVILQEL